ncbi:hypothetical protein HGRIS_005037 [Hohenbuehelia grisea]|uniref:Helicase C-terminal domain-containing protein n=1 Tax=Hohenbuehelia grisea TaxID=104357 RepID=A0ABR3JE00_9AGAR
MAKEKPTTKRPSGQKSITSFFGGGGKKAQKEVKEASDTSDNDYADNDTVSEEEGNSDVDMDEPEEPKAKRAEAKGSAPDASGLPPIHSIPSMFDDLVSRIPKIKDVAQRVLGRKLRIATMCSGTESPLLALELIQKSIKDQYGVDLDVEHVFSCEIEPFKQAYIERNFHPPLLFRDVCELGDAQAHTAYGALAPVPGDVDMLIAGTSCVDYSNLNNEKQDIDANGESGRTFRGMMSWVKRHRPPLVILENVCSAPWAKVQEYFEANGYSAEFTRVDTKFYYIPHTRTRVYLVAVDKKNSSIPKEWKEYVTSKLKRPASSTLDAFLLATDDPRIHLARQKLVRESYNALDRRTGRTDWSRCESRHQRARLDEALGSKRPLTSWDEGGSSKLPDFAWGDWGVGQVERVWDLLDISLLRSAKNGIDPSYKTQVWNLSQNVDRTIGSSKVGICPCLTPSMIPYITNRGGPMVGLEALSMQGLPVDKLLLTRESEDQLADLAGNAMSTTVVGSCILAALVTGMKLLKAGDDNQTYETKQGIEAIDDEEDIMDVDLADAQNVAAEDKVVGEEQLVTKTLALSDADTHDLSTLLSKAEKSARLCQCEGRVDMTTRELYRCSDCETSFCKKCGGRPEHSPSPINLIANPRLSPSAFAKDLKSALPMCIVLSNVTTGVLDALKKASDLPIPAERWSSWKAAVLRAAASQLRFVEPKRQEIWTAVYESPAARLELLLHPRQPEWRMYAKPEEHEPANAEIRQVLENPVGRLTCADGLLQGKWEFALPQSKPVSVQIEGVGELVPSWEARLGLMGDEFREQTVFSQLKITVPDDKENLFDRRISGTYTLFDKCGTANGALHRKESTEDEASLPSLFMFLDPHRTNDSKDAFVFSVSKRRYEYGEYRPIICTLDPKWRQSSDSGTETVTCYIPCHWARSEKTTLQPARLDDAHFAIPDRGLEVSISHDACQRANALLVCSVPLGDQAGPEWPRGAWQEVDKIHERMTFKALAWLLERIRHVDDHFSSWQQVEVPDGPSNCERCAPSAPQLRWTQVKRKFVAVENNVQAGEYERRLKRRPSPFVTQLKLDEHGVGHVRIGINIPTLLHRALSRLPTKDRSGKAALSWRLNTNFTPAATTNLPKFELLSNRADKEHAKPPSFKIPLRKEQLRSLEWMIQQESTDAPPFIEEEISEAILDPLGWRAEGCAQRPVHVRGGVLADQVGYGKTAITLGLIDCMAKEVKTEFKNLGRVPGKIAVKGTLIVVPPHLTRQWASEVLKFVGKGWKVVTIASVSNLNSFTVEDAQEADIVVVASNIWKSNVYLDNLQAIAGAGDLPAKEGRHFNSHLEKVLEALKGQVDRLQDKGSAAVLHEIKESEKRLEAEAAKEAALQQSKRLKGKSYRDAAETAAKAKKDSKPPPPTTSSRSPPFDKVVEVLIPVKAGNGSKNVKATSRSEAEDSDEESDAPRKRPARSAAKKVITISDSEDEDEAPKSKKAPAKNGTSKQAPKRRSSKADESSDYEHSSDVEKPSDSESDLETAMSSDDEPSSKSKSKSKAKAKPKAKPPRKSRSVASSRSSEVSASSNDEDETTDADAMDVDEEPKAKGKGKTNGKKPAAKKRKAVNTSDDEDEDRPAKKQKRQDADPWKLGTAAVKKDWTLMRAPPLEMFQFARVVVDEYTYLDGKIHALVTRLTASRHWVLSGTPPIHDFAAVKTIAAFLNLHLGVDDDGEGQSVEVKKRRREQTAVEKFHSFREVHTLEWHAHRHQLGQRFLDQFVRQNIAEIDEIPWVEKRVPVDQPAAERAIYLELEHYLRAIDMTIKRGKKSESDREKRLAVALGESKTAEEALLKRCSHFELETTNENAMKACDVIVRERSKQLEECKAELLRALKDGVKREKDLKAYGGDESMFNEYVRVTREEDAVGDREARDVVVGLLDSAQATAAKPGKSKGGNDNLSEKIKERLWDHREKTHEIRRLTKELVGRVRSLRYFTVVRDLQKQRETPPVVSCPGCDREQVPIAEVAVLSSCGHMGCLTCVKAAAEKEECVYAADGACKSAARVLNVVRAETLGVDDEARDGRGKHFGMKLEKIVSLIKNDVPKKERVLLFVQFPDLMKKVAEALSVNGIAYLEIRGTAHQKSKNLEKFQNESGERVLLLNVMDESASGANLTSANHAIFLSPLLAPSAEIYQACETQAVGRLVRFGQNRLVHVYRFLTTSTIDEEIYEHRRVVMMRDTSED